MKDLGEVKKILDMEVTRDRGSGKLWLSQENYVLKVLERFNMAEARPVILWQVTSNYPPSGVHITRRGGGDISSTICCAVGSCMQWSALGLT